MYQEIAKIYVIDIGKEDIILGTDWLLEYNLKVDWHAYGLHLTQCPPSCYIKEGLVKAKRAFKKKSEPLILEENRIDTEDYHWDFAIILQ